MMGQKRIKHRPGDIVNKDDLQAVMKNISASMKRYYVPFFLSLFLLVGSVIVAIVSPDILKKMTKLLMNSMMMQIYITTTFLKKKRT